jgi:hypothetical protein
VRLLAFMAVGFVLALWLARRRAKRARELVSSPLAGFDTGARSPWRTPKSVRFHRGL